MLLRPLRRASLLRIVFGICVLFTASFSFLIARFRPPLGDDVLTQCSHAINLYLSTDRTGDVGGRIDSFSKALEEVSFGYMHWGGRLVGFLLGPMRSLLGDGFIGVATTFVMCGLAFLGCVHVCGSTRRASTMPFSFLMFFMTLFVFTVSAGYLFMWTILTIYVVSASLLLAYAHVHDLYVVPSLKARTPVRHRTLLLICFFGFVAGITHEVFGSVMLGYILLRNMLRIGSRTFFSSVLTRVLVSHLGLICGLAVQISAPGNFVRMRQSHDAEPLARPWVTRLVLSFREHLQIALVPPWQAFLTGLLVLATVAFIAMVCFRPTRIRGESLALVGLTLAPLPILVLLWSFAPYTPSYGAVLFLFFEVLFIASVLHLLLTALNTRNTHGRAALATLSSLVAVSGAAAFAIQNVPWLRKMMQTTTVRERLIEEAIAKRQKTVEVPTYGGERENRFLLGKALDLESTFAWEYVQSYFGVRIVPVDPAKD